MIVSGSFKRAVIGRVQDNAGGLHRVDQNRQHDREQNQREQDFAHPGVHGYRRQQRAHGRKAKRADQEYQNQVGDFLPDRQIEKDQAEHEYDHFRDQHEYGGRQHFPEVDDAAVHGNHQQPLQAAVFLFRGEHAVEPERAGEGECDPEHAGHRLPNRVPHRLERKVEDHQDHDAEKQHGIERILGPQLDEQILAEDRPDLCPASHRSSARPGIAPETPRGSATVGARSSATTPFSMTTSRSASSYPSGASWIAIRQVLPRCRASRR